jgi:hypothetical protein
MMASSARLPVPAADLDAHDVKGATGSGWFLFLGKAFLMGGLMTLGKVEHTHMYQTAFADGSDRIAGPREISDH